MSGRHKMDVTLEQLLVVVVVMKGGEMEITGDDIDAARGQAIGIKVDDDKITLKALSAGQAELLGSNNQGEPN
jgi:hypothetical protein